MKFWTLLAVLLLTGCASSKPYIEARMAHQLDRMSDWVLQPERDWICSEEAQEAGTCDSELRLFVQAGFEWPNQSDCYFETTAIGPWDQAWVGCSRMFGAKDERGWFIRPELRHQINDLTSDFLQTDQTQWQGYNPFVHLRVGYRYSGFKINVATGMSTRCIAKLKKIRDVSCPDLYWTNIEVGARYGGYTGMWQ